MSRFLREVPVQLLSSGRTVERDSFEMPKQEAYFQAKQAFQTKPFQAGGYQNKVLQSGIFDKPKPVKSFGVKAGGGLDYEVGDRVRSAKYGEGIVTGIVEGGRDYEITVAYDSGQVRKAFARFAQLQKIEE